MGSYVRDALDPLLHKEKRRNWIAETIMFISLYLKSKPRKTFLVINNYLITMGLDKLCKTQTFQKDAILMKLCSYIQLCMAVKHYCFGFI